MLLAATPGDPIYDQAVILDYLRPCRPIRKVIDSRNQAFADFWEIPTSLATAEIHPSDAMFFQKIRERAHAVVNQAIPATPAERESGTDRQQSQANLE